MTAISPDRVASTTPIQRGIREALYAGAVSFGLFFLLIGIRTDQNIRNELILVQRWGLLAIVASDRPITVDGAAFARAAAALAPPPRHPDLLLTTPRRLVELYVGDWPARPGATLNRDDTLRLELDAPKRDRRSLTLTGDRLVGVYRRVWLPLARRELVYTPPPNEHPWDPDYGIRQQMGAAGEDGTPPD